MPGAAVTLIITGMAKLFTTTGTAGALSQPDPLIWFLTAKGVLGVAGLLELLIATVVLASNVPATRRLSLATLCGLVLPYRSGLHVVGAPGPCKCLGSIAAAIHLTDSQASFVASALLVVLSAGTTACFLLARRSQSDDLNLATHYVEAESSGFNNRTWTKP